MPKYKKIIARSKQKAPEKKAKFDFSGMHISTKTDQENRRYKRITLTPTESKNGEIKEIQENVG